MTDSGDDSGLIQSLSPHPHGLPYQQNESLIRWPFSTHNQLEIHRKNQRGQGHLQNYLQWILAVTLILVEACGKPLAFEE